MSDGVGSYAARQSTTREFDFLLAAVRRFFRPQSPLPPVEGLNWSEIVRLADRHAVTPFLRHACQSPELRDRSLDEAHFNLTLSAELAKLLDLFETRKIDVVSLKGPVLGVALYGDEALKTSSDLDLLVRPGDASRAIRALQAAGYLLDSDLHWPAQRAYLRDPNSELSLSDPTGRIKLDLHWRLLPTYFPTLIDEAELWTGLRSVPWARTRARTLAPEHLLLFLCVHGTKHLWERLGWLCDTARLIQMERELDWSWISAQARRTDTRPMVSLGLLLASDLLGVDLPPAAAELAVADARARSLTADVLERFRAGSTASAADTTMFLIRAFERSRSRVRLVVGVVFQPNEADYRALQLPPGLYWLYYLFRPLRLAVRYGRRLVGL